MRAVESGSDGVGYSDGVGDCPVIHVQHAPAGVEGVAVAVSTMKGEVVAAGAVMANKGEDDEP